MPPFALPPVRLRVAHLSALGALVIPVGVVEGLFETALSALPDEEEDEARDQHGSDCSRTDEHAGVGACR